MLHTVSLKNMSIYLTAFTKFYCDSSVMLDKKQNQHISLKHKQYLGIKEHHCKMQIFNLKLSELEKMRDTNYEIQIKIWLSLYFKMYCCILMRLI